MPNKIKRIFGFIFFFFFFFFFLVFFVFFSLGNKEIIKLNFFPIPIYIEIPLYILFMSLIFIGFVIGMLFSYFRNFLK